MKVAVTITSAVFAFIIDYIKRHAHPVNAACHLVGVPLAFFGLCTLVTGRVGYGLVCLVLGYLLQYIGHRAQGNEVGEVTLIKSIWRKVMSKKAMPAGGSKAQTCVGSQTSGKLVEASGDH